MAPEDLVEAMERFPAAVLSVDATGRVLWANASWRARMGVPGKGTPDLPLADDASRAKYSLSLARARSGEAHECELIVQPDDVLQPMTFTFTPTASGAVLVEQADFVRSRERDDDLLDLNSELVNAQRELRRERGDLARVLEQLRRRTEELERTNAALDEFAHVLSHDLRAPLRAITKLAEFLEQDAGPALSEESAGHLRMLRSRAEQLETLIAGILEVSRAGRRPVHPVPLDASAVVREVVDLIGPASDVEIVVHPLPEIVADPAALRQVLLNLLSNAIEHGRSAGGVHVEVGCVVTDSHVTFFVQDRGPGVPRLLRDRIWQPFFTGRAGGSGSGIGLSIVRSVVEANGGAVRLADADHGGARFEFDWPRRETEVLA